MPPPFCNLSLSTKCRRGRGGGLYVGSLVPRPLPLEERPGTHCLRMRKIVHYIFRKKLRALPCPYVEDYTNQEYRAFFEIHSSDENPAGILFRGGSIIFTNIER